MTVPTSPLVYGDDGYSEVHQRWLDRGQPDLLEHLSGGWLRKAIWPTTGATTPTFVLICSSPDYHVHMTRHSSWRRRTSLPRSSV